MHAVVSKRRHVPHLEPAVIPPPPDLDSLLNKTLTIDGVEHRVRLRVPSTRKVHPTMSPPETSQTTRAIRWPSIVLALIERLDDTPSTRDLAQTIADNPSARTRVFKLREALFSSLIDAGVARPACPSCGAEVELSLPELAGLVRSPPKPLCDRDGNFTVPELADLAPVGLRPWGVRVAARMGFTLPGARVGLGASAHGGDLGDLESEESHQRQDASWREWAPWNTPQPPERSHWNLMFPGFRAVLQMSCAVTRLEGVAGRITPEVIESLPATDWLFLDRLYALTRRLSLSDGATPVTCPNCQTRFLPVTA